MRKFGKILAWSGAAIVIVAAAALWWWTNQAPDAVDLETAVRQLEAVSLDEIDSPGATRPSEDAGMTSTTGYHDEPPTEVGAAAETRDPAVAIDAPVDAPNPPGDHDAPSTGTVAAMEPTSTDTAPLAQSDDDIGDTPGTGSNAGATDDGPSTGAGATETTTAGRDAEAFAGLWTVSAPDSAGLPGESAVSFAGFRVVEVLAGGVAESTAVGRTDDVAGSIEIADGKLVAARVEVVIATLRTDNSHRDSHMRHALNTNEYPLAVFTLVEPVELPPGVFQDETFSGTAHGDLTIKGVTNQAVFELQARRVGDTIVAVGSSRVVFSDYGVPTPTSISVISVEDHGIIELLLYFTRQP